MKEHRALQRLFVVCLVIFLSGCAFLEALRYRDAKDPTTNQPITRVKDQFIDVKSGVCEEKALVRALTPEQLEAVKKLPGEWLEKVWYLRPEVLNPTDSVSGRAISPLVGALLASAGATAVKLAGEQVKGVVSKLKPDVTYSSKIYLSREAFDRAINEPRTRVPVCIFVGRFERNARGEVGRLGMALKLKAIKRGDRGFSIRLEEWLLRNATVPVLWKESGDERVLKVKKLAVGFKVVGVLENDGVNQKHEITDGALALEYVPIKSAVQKCGWRGSACPETEIMALPTAKFDSQLLAGIGITETGSFSDTSVTEAQVAAVQEALSSAVAAGLKGEFDQHNADDEGGGGE